MSIFESYAKLIGFYYTRDYNTTLSLNANNTVLLSSNGSSYRGYWRDKGDGRPVELEFSETVKIRFGYEEEYHSSLYFYNNVFPEKNKKLFLIIFKKKYKNSTVTFSLS